MLTHLARLRLNQTVIKNSSPGVWLGASGLLYTGPLPTLDWHVHPFACALFCPTGLITAQGRGEAITAPIVLAGAGVRHRLSFSAGATVASLYIAPHDPDFAYLRRAAPDDLLGAPRSDAWSTAWARWGEARDASAMRAAIRQSFLVYEDDQGVGAEVVPSLDHRALRLLRAMARGELLRSTTRALADEVGLSASRLAHLIKAQTGVTPGSLQRGYRFWRAAHAVASGANFTQAAHEADFADAAHFSRAFRDAYGTAPTGILDPSTTWAMCGSVG